MKMVLILILALLTCSFQAEAAEVFDSEGKRVFYTIDTGNTQLDKGLHNGQVVTTAYPVQVLINDAGQVFEYDYNWEVIISNDEVFLDYDYNRWQWKWVEGIGLKPSQSARGDAIRRLYEEEELIDSVTGNYEGEYVYTTPEQGDQPFMTYIDGKFYNEFGDLVFSVDGPFKRWWRAVVVHQYYEKFYGNITSEDLEALRDNAREKYGYLTTLAEEMITIGSQSERTFGGTYIMIYFVELEDGIFILTEDQVRLLKNKWLIINEKTRRGSAPRIIPEGGFFVKTKEARNRGIEGVSGNNFVLEIKIKPEYIPDFRSEVLLLK